MLVAGVDEVGRGTLAGGVFASAVILDPREPIIGLKDSKKLSEKQRERLQKEIKEKALSFSIAEASVEEIDALNILKASLLAMRRAVDSLSIKPEFVLVDGTHIPTWNYSAKAIIRGDSKIAEIAAASVLAKVRRDHEMVKQGDIFPEYGFSENKGYPTKKHREAILKFGANIHHRKSFQLIPKQLKLF